MPSQLTEFKHKALEFFADQNHWTQGTSARDENEYALNDVNDPTATKFCLAGYWHHLFGKDKLETLHDRANEFRDQLNRPVGAETYRGAARLNDGTDYETVMEFLRWLPEQEVKPDQNTP